MEKALVLGASSMIGSHVVELLQRENLDVLTPSHDSIDLEIYENIYTFLKEENPDYIFNFSGYNGGIAFNEKYPFDIFTINTRMINNLLTAISVFKPRKVINIIPSCSYPDSNLSLYETDYFEGAPASSVSCHGFAKRNLVAGSIQLWKQYKINSIVICANTVYGPKDKFDINKSKVVGSLITKFVEAKEKQFTSVELFSPDTYRGFIYVKDLAKALMECFLVYNSQEILNLESEEIKIKDLAEIIKKIVGYDGFIIWNPGMGGQTRKMLDFSKSHKLLKYRPEYTLQKGLEETVDWYLNKRTKMQKSLAKLDRNNND